MVYEETYYILLSFHPSILLPTEESHSSTQDLHSYASDFSLTAGVVFSSSVDVPTCSSWRTTPFCVRPISSANVECGTHLAELRGFVSSNMRSTCSRESPLVSGTRKYAKEKERQQSEPHKKNTLAPRFASPLFVPTRYGVMTPMICSPHQHASHVL